MWNYYVTAQRAADAKTLKAGHAAIAAMSLWGDVREGALLPGAALDAYASELEARLAAEEWQAQREKV